MINIIDKSLFEVDTMAIIHQTNCMCTQNSGIAKQIRAKYPEEFEADCKTIPGDIKKLGTFSWVKAHDGKHIYNCYSQFRYGREQRHTNYEAVYTGLSAILSHMNDYGIQSVNLPYNMGCALGGGDFRIVKSIIDVVFDNWAGTVNICKYTPK